MHWQLATTAEDVNAGGTFTFNACLREGQGTSVVKKVTCKTCKPLTTRPTTILQAANLYMAQVRLLNGDGKSDFFITITCNACDREANTYNVLWYSEKEAVQELLGILAHCAYDHTLGTELSIGVHSALLSAYELNAAVGKPPATDQEVAWRTREVV